jgi:hypothetical protein
MIMDQERPPKDLTQSVYSDRLYMSSGIDKKEEKPHGDSADF